jgi:hypothetical protein
MTVEAEDADFDFPCCSPPTQFSPLRVSLHTTASREHYSGFIRAQDVQRVTQFQEKRLRLTLLLVTEDSSLPSASFPFHARRN